ncbi:phosphoribosylformylglycinamidine synthase subunit PurL [Zavarzinia sp.]|uniref:phosphoribosylformylglycinamidine synthase subunit PurL n=1 Tax=Zavarzinia sp. TaxID=2027920 RepID=UPI003562BB4C
MTEITPEIVAEHGLSPDEYQHVLRIMGRTPNLTELGIFSVMWSEHCSYKSSRLHLKKLPTKGPQVICGPGENAGVVDIGDGLAAVFKMESHNHPSYIEPYQGAATGVGGILRDVFTMGARPIAILDPLRFGSPEHPKTRHLVSGVVAGIGGYGNCMGIPNVGGECTFHAAYDGNILVNAMTVGIAHTDKIFYSAAAGIGNPVVYVGSKTGRDGIHGATMASAEFDEKSEEKRPTVQVGDPFVEKLLLEACLELMAGDAIVAIQDMGAAGLTSSSVEMASKGGVGIELDLDHVPQRETHMTAYEMMLSESQERMLMILKPGREQAARAIFHKWGLDFAVIGKVTDTGHLVLKHGGAVVGDIPVGPLTDESPLYDRPWEPTPKPAEVLAAEVPHSHDLGATLVKLLGTPDLCSKRWIVEQYDHLVGGDTIVRPGGDAAVVRVRDHATKGLAITTDCTPRYCLADPVEGGKQAVVETYRNITAVGGLPLAITDCMNFGNPQRPEIMGQFVGAIEGMSEACLALDYPVVSGNVSLYNETMGTGVQPTPAIGGIGLLEDYTRSASIRFKAAGETILLVGETEGWLGASIYLRDIAGREDGAPPPVDLAVEKRNGDFVRGLIRHGEVGTCHDVSDGGLLVALAEMALAGGIGATLATPETEAPLHAFWFGEDQGRYLLSVAVDRVESILDQARSAGVPVAVIGTTGGDAISVDGGHKAPLAVLRDAFEGWLPRYMAS